MPNQRTSCSTTAPAAPVVETASGDGVLSAVQRELVLALFQKGASPTQICRELGLDIRLFWNTVDADAAFVAGLRLAIDALSHNVVTALYKEAINGNVAAQQFWLKQCPAPLWQPPTEDPDADDFPHLDDLQLAQELAQTCGDLAVADEPDDAA